MTRKFLLDTNVLIALTEAGHIHHQNAQNWLNSSGEHEWGICPLTEMGFLRITTNSKSYPNPRTFGLAIAILEMVKAFPGFCYWEIKDSWVALTAPFASRISGHQQVTDAYLLGLAIKEDGMLVTFDRGVAYMAGDEYRQNVQLLGARPAA